jgi:hypothetical protein
MDMVKVTFTLDEQTVRSLRGTAARLAKPQSQVVREAVMEYAARAGRLSERERLRLLKTFDEVVPALPGKSANAVDKELREIRTARKQGGRRHSA